MNNKNNNKICPFLNKPCIENDCMLFIDKTKIKNLKTFKTLAEIDKKCSIWVSAIYTTMLNFKSSK